MVVQAVVDEGEGEFLSIYLITQNGPMEFLSLDVTFVSVEHLGHSHILLATFEKVTKALFVQIQCDSFIELLEKHVWAKMPPLFLLCSLVLSLRV